MKSRGAVARGSLRVALAAAFSVSAISPRAAAEPIVFGLVVGSFNNDRLIVYRANDGSFQQNFIQAGALDGPHGLAFGPDGNLYVSSAANDRVLRHNGVTLALQGTFASGNGLDGPTGLGFGPDDHVYVSSSATDSVLRYHGTTGAFIDTFVAAASGGLDQPRGLTFGPDGKLYVASALNNSVLSFEGTTGNLLGTFVPSGSGGLDSPQGLVFGPDGSLYVSSFFSDQVLRYHGTTGASLGAFVAANSGGLDGPTGLAFGPDGNLYVSSFLNDRVLRYEGATGAFIDTFVAAGSANLDGPNYLAFTPPGGPPSFLDNGPGDGTLRVGVDGFGSFGSGIGAAADHAFYDPVGAGGAAGTTFESAVAIRIGDSGGRTFLTSGEIAGSGGLPNPSLTGNSSTVSSAFVFQGLGFDLVQTLSPMLSGGMQVGSRLTQVYSITNTTADPLSFELLRYVDADLLFNGTFIDGGGRFFANGIETLFETDSATGSADPTTLMGITAEGGIIPPTMRFEISSTQAASSIRSRIVAGGGLSDTVVGDGADADEFIDAGGGYDVNLALGNLFSLGPGEQTVYTTATISGSLAPEEVPPNEAPVADAGPDRTVRLGCPVTLNGTGADPDSGPGTLTFAWVQTAGPAAVPLAGANSATPSFTPIVADTYVFELVVNDGAAGSPSDSTTITVPPLGEVDLDGDVDKNDLNLILAARNTLAVGPDDLRDVNCDGTIDVLDARKAATRCTRPLCATQ